MLSFPAARLLVLLVFEVGFGNTLLVTAAELGSRIGFPRRQTVYKAWRELEAEGYVRTRGANGRTGITLLPPPTASLGSAWLAPEGSITANVEFDEDDDKDGNHSLSFIRPASVAADEGYSQTQADSGPEVGGVREGATPGGVRPDAQGCAPTRTGVRVDAQGVCAQTDSVRVGATRLLEECLEADALPQDGAPNQKTSAFQVRRRKQIELVRAIFAQEFPSQPALTVDNAKTMLRLCDERAEDVYDAVIGLSQWKPTAPLSYTLATLQKRRSRMQAQPLQAAPSPRTQGSSALAVSADLPDASPEWLREQDEAEAVLRELGWEG